MKKEFYKPSWTVPVIDFKVDGFQEWHPLITIQGVDSGRAFRVPRRDVKVLNVR